jgi:hypothetical protein
MGALPRGLLVSVCAVLLAAVLAHAAEPETASMVVGLAKCADCSRKNMNAEAVLKGTFIRSSLQPCQFARESGELVLLILPY